MIKINKMCNKNIDDIVEIENLSFNIPWTRKSFEDEIKNDLAQYFVIKKFLKVIGYGGMWLILDEAHITNIAIHPTHRSHGYGIILVKYMINYAKENNITKMTLEVRKSNIVAIDLYKKLGFEEKGLRKSYYADNMEDAVIMWRINND